MKLTIIAFLVCGFFVSCTQQLSPAKYLEYAEKNPAEFTLETGETVNYSVTYSPVEYIVAQNAEAFSKQDAKEELKKMKGMAVSSFELRIKVPTGNLFSQNRADKSEQMEYYSAAFKKNIKAITTDADTLDCSGFFFQANGGFGTTSYFSFEIPNKIGQLKELIIESTYLGEKVTLDLTSFNHPYPKLRITK